MNVLECLIGAALSVGIIAPVLQSGSDLVIAQTQLQRAAVIEQDAHRMLELMARDIRLAGYRNITRIDAYHQSLGAHAISNYLGIEKRSGWRHSDALWLKHEPADMQEVDCLGNAVTQLNHTSAPRQVTRTKGGLRHQGFSLQVGHNGLAGSLMCTSLDRQGRLQNTVLMSQVQSLQFEWASSGSTGGGAKGIQIRLKTSASDHEFSRFIAFRNAI